MGKAPRGHLTVFEAINRDLGEIYLGTTTEQMHSLANAFFDSRPELVAHWKPSHRIDYHSLEFGLDADDARHFMDGYEKAASRERWRVLRSP